MSSVLKPSSVTQNTPVPAQLNKPMHPQQGPPQSYGQPSNHHSMVPHGNPTAAHNHPATHQSNHFSLNVPNSYIPASNHPVPNNPSQPPSQQIYSGAKNMSYQGGYQPNMGLVQNQSSNQLPPVTQSLPATNSQSVPHPPEESTDKSHSNGTTEEKSSYTQENHVTTPKEISTTPALPTQAPKPQEKPAEPQKADEQENAMALDACASSTTPQDGPSDQQVSAEVAESSSGSGPKEPAQNEVDGDVQNEKKTEEVDGVEEEGKADVAEEKSSEDKQEPSVAESDSANTPNDSEKAVSESVENEAKEKSTPKRTNPRKTSRVTKGDEEPKTPRDPKPSPSQKSPSTSKSKRARIKTQPYQSPLPELEIISKISASQRNKTNKTNDEKLIVFFKNEFLAVRNPEGSFYVCQAVQNIYKSSAKIRIRWLSLDKNDKTNQIYTPDFYDHTDFDCILTNLNLERIEKGKFRLPPAEKERTDSILKRSLAAEKGEEIPSPTVNEEHPDGLDLSLYKDENQLNKRKSKKRKATSPLRSSSRSPSKPSPEKAKVAKPTPKSSKKPAAKKEAPAAVKKTPTATPVAKKTSGSRTERAKRRSDTANSTKVTPVSPKVDQKKAKALAKVARKTAVAAPKVQTPAKKDTKETKSTTPASKSTKTTVKVATTSSAKKKTPKRSAAKK